MAQVNVGTILHGYNLVYPGSIERQIVKTTEGKLVVFVVKENALSYKTSSDNGATWSASWTAVGVGKTCAGFDIKIHPTTNDIYIVASRSMYLEYFVSITLTYDSINKTWSENPSTVISTNYISEFPTLAIKSDGSFIACGTYGDGHIVRTYKSTDNGAIWSYISTFSNGTVHPTGSQLIAVGDEIWAFVRYGAALILFKYTTSWDSGTTIIASGIASYSTIGFGCGKISNDEIYVSVCTASGIRVYKYDGSTWDSGTLLSSAANDHHPSISNVGGFPVVVWLLYNSTYNLQKISYRLWNGVSWDTRVDISSGNLEGYAHPTSCEEDLNSLYCIWEDISPSPHNIYFSKTILFSTYQELYSDAKIKVLDNQQTLTSDAEIYASISKTLLSDAVVKVIDIPKTLTSDAIVKIVDIQETLTSDAEVTFIATPQTLLSDAKIKVLDNQQTILSDSKIAVRSQPTIVSDAKIHAHGIVATILANARIVIPVLEDLNNKFSFVKAIISDISNKFSYVTRELKDISSVISFVTREIIDIGLKNDIRTKKLELGNIENDIRFLASWQVPGNAGFQSLGKTYIRVYINTVEQTTVDVDSVSIDKIIDGEHTASFTLGTTYDSTKPTMESIVEIKYNNWVIYKGYITTITPADSPESIVIGCKDKYWKNNRTNKYFFVGNTPKDNTELYYNTIATALTTAFSWTPGIGNFVPDEIGCFSVGESTAITNLVNQCGNYSFYYDVTETKQLWIAGQGSIVDLDRQVIGINLDLYDVISHQTRTSIDGLINKYRVQMGDRTIKRLGNSGGDSYSSYHYMSFNLTVTPEWSSSLQGLAKYSGGYGYDYHKPEDNYLYKDVFVKYSLGMANLGQYESWTDFMPVYVEITSTGTPNNFKPGSSELTDGYTIDYAKSLFILNTPLFCYETNQYGEALAIKPPLFHINLWKKIEYNVTSDPSDDPETDITNPLLFFTAKMGSYATEVIADLNLSNLSIQVGGVIHNADGTDTIVASWDDTLYATDFANWQLSQLCDEKIETSIEVTLDCLCFNSIDLKNRIYIDGITTSAMNIKSISIDVSSFICRISLENSRYYNRTVSLSYRGD